MKIKNKSGKNIFYFSLRSLFYLFVICQYSKSALSQNEKSESDIQSILDSTPDLISKKGGHYFQSLTPLKCNMKHNLPLS